MKKFKTRMAERKNGAQAVAMLFMSLFQLTKSGKQVMLLLQKFFLKGQNAVVCKGTRRTNKSINK